MEHQSNQLRRDLAFIQGLMEGNGDLGNRPEGTVLKRLVSVLDEMAEENEQLRLRLTELEEYVEAVDEDLNELELILYDEDEEGDEEEEDIGYWEVECPECQQQVLVDDELLDDEEVVDIMCPQCDRVLLADEENDKAKAHPTH
ncbi:CD1247 N-terminal domain-containing protein [Desmospora profundinema]|uniref:Endogenous inhibitor of DNA gyrase (YacG/DUF329 family) n=1 Tax=Desmospora profundinema TaxID=1571184 RepID=A0ABU1IIT6_9BACL|nr:CD1247 N-terminal domain-containing protein [Desmospora profundinema]MDR6224663.1 endogenous inhibitor of DNA gyrase (YacG/DUF329 family) [Desmospora profundinema]